MRNGLIAMSHDTTLSAEDEGKTVMNQDGETIGTLREVRGDEAFVDPDPGLADAIMSKLGWTAGQDDDTYRFKTSAVKQKSDDEIHLEL